MQNYNLRGLIAVIVALSLVVGAVAGALGSFFVEPYLEQSNWGQQFLNKDNISCQDNSETATVSAVNKVSPSVVSIVISKDLSNYYNMTGPFNFYFNGQLITPGNIQEKSGTTQKQAVGGGTGFVIDANGLILTNRHVVADTEADYTVVFNDGKKYTAEVLARDTVNDLAVLKIDAKNLPVADLGDSDKMQIGQSVIAIGNSLSEYSNTVTAGIVSGINRSISAGDSTGSSELINGAIQTDAAINPGNSGGPLVNLSGKVIGINTAINSQGQSLGFAIPINQAKKVIDSVRQYGRIVRPWLGVRYVQLNSDIATQNKLKYDFGAWIVAGQAKSDTAVVSGSPADKAGLKENDIILEVNGQKLDDQHSLVDVVSNYNPGDTIQLKVFSKDAEKNVAVKLEERKQ